MAKTPIRKRVMATERKAVIGSWRIKVIAAEKGNGEQKQARAGCEAKPVALKEVDACSETKCHVEEKVDAHGGLFPKKKIERPAEQNDDEPETIWVGFHGDLQKEFLKG